MLDTFGKFISEYQHYRNGAMIDKNHVSLIYSNMICHKPDTILEIGIGTGLVTYSLLYGRQYNGKGEITSVDNWHDWDGIEPPEIDNLRKNGVRIITSNEEYFVRNCQDKFDFIVVDGDHSFGHEWADVIVGLLNPGGVLFSHDVRLFPKLSIYEDIAKNHGLSYKIFDKSSRPDDRCDRGFIIIYK
jgi:predicted O-methyltransferase YrrM